MAEGEFLSETISSTPQVHSLEAAGECTSEVLFAPGISQVEQCRLALANCDAAGMMNFYKLYFCTMETSNVSFYPIGVSTPSLKAGPFQKQSDRENY